MSTLIPQINLPRTSHTPISYFVILFLLAATHLWLPVERGFASIYIGGYPFTLTFIVTVACFSWLFLRSKGGILLGFRNRFCIMQGVFVLILILSSLLSPEVARAMSVGMRYFTTWILNYLILIYLLRRGAQQHFVSVFCFVSGIAALIGIMEGIFRVQIPFYANLLRDYRLNKGMDLQNIDPELLLTRTFGTLGNPIIYAVAMILAIPFAMEIRSRFVKIALVTLLFSAALLTVSRTALLMAVVLALGYAFINKKKHMQVILGALLFIGITLGTFSNENSIFSFSGLSTPLALWSERLGFTKGREAEDAQMNIEMRQSAIQAVINEFDQGTLGEAIFGRGIFSTSELGEQLRSGLHTIDNTYFTIFYECGFIGLVCFIVTFGGLLWRTKSKATHSLHWYNLLALLIAGGTFVFHVYATFNFLAVASIAFLTIKLENRYNAVPQRNSLLRTEQSNSVEATLSQ